MKQERSEAQKLASRLNGSHSHGPATPEGVERCRLAATIHGMYSPQIVAPNEDRSKYERLLAHYILEYNPVGDDERDLVTDMVNARWRIRRAWGHTTGMVSAEMIINRDATERAYTPVTAELRTTTAISALETAHPGLLYRFQAGEESLKRIIRTSRKELVALQTDRLGEKPRRNPQPVDDLVFFPSSNVIEFLQPENAGPTPVEAESDTEMPETSEIKEPPAEAGKGPENYDQSIWTDPQEFRVVSRYIPSADELRSREERWGPPPVDLAA
ncbi:MAG: hypothetical protein HY820_40540 [Acidobacteria bacterium]|nr:hypothetical protein [Acidobacteriota bacterium]